MLKISKTKKMLSAAVLGSLLCTTSSQAGEPAVTKEIKPVEEPVKSKITGDFGAVAISKYISRGLVLEDSGLIVQPYADLYFNLYEGSGFINKVTFSGGIWSSLNGDETDAVAGSTVPNWYEFDWDVFLAVDFAKYFTAQVMYIEFISPNDGFGTAKNLELKLAINDSELLGAFSLKPYVKTFFELDGKAGSGASEGVYFEVGITPSVAAGPVTFSFPVVAGFGANDFYADDQGFGYVSAGVSASVPLSFVPAGYGSWTAGVNGTYFNGETLNDFGRNDGDDTIIGSFSIGATF
jgi:hypothetical protein